jgi:hypothetical protein
MNRTYTPAQTSSIDGHTVLGSGTVVVVTSTLQLSRVDASNESIRTSESVHAPSTAMVLNADSVRVSVVGE